MSWRLLALAALGPPALLLFGSWAWIEHKGARRLAPLDAAPARRVALVLGAHVEAEVPSRALEARLERALELLRRGTVAHLLLSGARHSEAYDEPRAMAAWLLARGVPASSLTRDAEGFRTIDSIRRARDVYAARELLVVSQAFHLHRALFLAEAAGLDAVGVAADDFAGARATGSRGRELLARARAFVEVYLLRALAPSSAP